jgi:hypothetical protein
MTQQFGPISYDPATRSAALPDGSLVGYPVAIVGQYPSLVAMSGLVALWDFDEDTGAAKVNKIGFPYALRDAGSANCARDSASPAGPMSGFFATMNGSTNYLRLEPGLMGKLNLGLQGNACTIVGLVYIASAPGLEFIAGVWGENNNDPRRQYGLFYNDTVYGAGGNVVGHISKTGDKSPGLPYSRDLASSKSQVELSRWCVMAMTYDGTNIRAYIDSRWEPQPTYTEPGAPNGEGLTYSKNPYAFAAGLNTGKLAEFTVGANRLTSGWTNNLNGRIGGLAVFNRALSQAELMRVQRVMYGANYPAICYTYYNVTYSSGTRGVNNLSANWFYYIGDTAQTGNTTTGWRLELPSGGSIRYLGRLPTASSAIAYDDETFGIPLAECTKITLKMNNLNTADSVCPMVKVAGVWYVSTTAFQQAVAGVSITDFTNEQTSTLNTPSAELWRHLTLVPGSTMSVGTGALLPANAVVDAIGVYTPSNVGQLVVRDLSLWAPLT